VTRYRRAGHHLIKKYVNVTSVKFKPSYRCKLTPTPFP